MKLTYEQMPEMAKVGDPTGKVPIKNHKGQVLRPVIKQWGQKPPHQAQQQGTRYMCTEEPQKLYPAHTASHSPTFPQAFSSQRQQPAAKR